jgi:uncharacterized membrane protein YeaQ/YmgE (transglycosylase-associated protein family)
MTFVVWVAVGLVSGFIVSKIINSGGHGLATDIVLGVLGAGIGGWLFKTFGTADDVVGLTLQSTCLVIVGALVVPVAHHVLVRNAR